MYSTATIKSIKKSTIEETYDLKVRDTHNFFLSNGILTHNSEGAGKSVFGQQIAKLVDPTFDISRMCMTPQEFTTAILKAKKAQAVVFDEAFTGLSSRQSLAEVNRLIVSLMMEMRQKNLFVIIIMPTFFLLDRYVALFRAKGLFHVYERDGKRGRWIYFNNKKKKILYILGKKLFSYGKPKSKLRGRFVNVYTINQDKYRDKKARALMKKSRITKSEVWKIQRDHLLWIIHKEFNISQNKISGLTKKYDCYMGQTMISDIFTELTKENELEKEKDKIKAEEKKEKGNAEEHLDDINKSLSKTDEDEDVSEED